MEAKRSTSVKRKPLSDCTNTTAAARRNPPSSAAKSVATLTKPLKSSNSDEPKTVTTSNSLKTQTSTGSNVSPNARSVPSHPPAPPTPLPDSNDRDRQKSWLLTAQSLRQNVKASKDKGKTVIEAPKDKGKMVIEAPIIQISNQIKPGKLELSSSAASVKYHLPGPPAVQSKKPDVRTWKDKGKMVLEASDAVSPHSALFSGIQDQDNRPSLTVYSQRRSRQRRKHADGINILPLSCPPGRRTKKKGVEPEDNGGDLLFGSLTDPPMHRKKRPRNKQDDSLHAMPQDEIERLKSYYADVDAFELPEEVASEGDLD